MKKRVRWKFVPEKLEESTGKSGNPGIGWYEIYTFPAGEDQDVLADGSSSQDALVLLVIELEAGNDTLPRAEMERFDRILAAFAGTHDIILRFVYDTVGKGMEREPGQFGRVCSHLMQLAPLLKKYASSIYVYQGMLVGSWGEMHSSKFVSGSHLKEMYRRLAEAAEGEFFLAVRKPSQWRQIFPETGGGCDTLTGLFNDGIMGSATDLGTYGAEPAACAGWEKPWCPEEEIAFQKKLCRTVPNGGEAVYGQDGGQPSLEQIVKRLADMHISYLNRCHDERMLSYWRTLKWSGSGVWNGVNGYDYIGAHLGYRFVVRRAEIVKKRGEEKAVLRVEIENTGFSPIYEKTELFAVYEDERGECREERVCCDVTEWQSGETVCIAHPVLPRAGKYYLSLRRKKDGRSILFANRLPAYPEGDSGTAGEDRVMVGTIVVRQVTRF